LNQQRFHQEVAMMDAVVIFAAYSENLTEEFEVIFSG
jgi:hypothetical protein